MRNWAAAEDELEAELDQKPVRVGLEISLELYGQLVDEVSARKRRGDRKASLRALILAAIQAAYPPRG